MDQVLSNFVKQNENTTGYFQGLNFVAHYIVVMMVDAESSLAMLRYIGDNLFAVVCIVTTRHTSTSTSTAAAKA